MDAGRAGPNYTSLARQVLCRLPNGQIGHLVVNQPSRRRAGGAVATCAVTLKLTNFPASACQIVLSAHIAKIPAWEGLSGGPGDTACGNGQSEPLQER